MTEESQKPNWLPLESNPDVLNNFISQLGVTSWQFFDVYGTDDDILTMVPQPVCALMLLFPITAKTEAYDKEQAERIKSNPQALSDKLWFMKQTIGNACGTIAVLHALANNLDKLELSNNSTLYQFFEKTRNLNSTDRASALERENVLASAHSVSAQEGQTRPPEPDSNINLHFIALIEKDGNLYEMDGRKSAPVLHGKTTSETFLHDAIQVVKSFMQRDSEELNFSILSLSKPPM